MNSIYDLFATDAKAEAEDGLVLDYGSFGRITIRRAGGANKGFARVLEAKLRPYRRQIQAGTLEEAVAERLLAEVYAETVLIGWQGIRDRDGQDIAFSHRAAVTLFTDLPELFRDVQEQAQKAANFRTAEIEESAKN
ncbi:MAG: hypothetical protein KJ904_08725 [Alphaproteobacteria bacterium]|nr:hypothetical protein [Alphaproteobacteria bacterium]MBU0796280.1 hypothetical protein [Alphaproteobacteria bacterium]MBU0887235.1 hypothetical protein [Alphaproteobacteria bacterium]MBU1812237.1 hypothetical protein [Alphaproteobacteria bacterium]MBU2089698.1 hypothetical protein [Alphaproteobacteria bacterium]